MRNSAKHHLSPALPGTLLSPGPHSEGSPACPPGLLLYLSRRCTPHQDIPHTQSSRWALPQWFLSWSLPGSLGCSWRKAPEGGDHNREGLQLWDQSSSSSDTCQREELGTSTSVAGSGPIQAEEGPAACVPIISEGDKCLWESVRTHTHTHANTSQWNSRKINCCESTQ